MKLNGSSLAITKEEDNLAKVNKQSTKKLIKQELEVLVLSIASVKILKIESKKGQRKLSMTNSIRLKKNLMRQNGKKLLLHMNLYGLSTPVKLLQLTKHKKLWSLSETGFHQTVETKLQMRQEFCMEDQLQKQMPKI